MQMSQENFHELLLCPRCLAAKIDDKYHCRDCDLSLPEANGLPWHSPLPEAAIADWKAHFLAYLHSLDDEVDRMNEALGGSLSAATGLRIKNLVAAKKAHAQEVLEFFKYLPLAYRDDTVPHALLGSQIPLGQNLVGYYHNAHRDWAWGKAENEASVELLSRALGKASSVGDIAVIGSGAGRLAYDLGERLSPDRLFLVDLNPLLQVVARKMFSGEAASLHEFPIAPLSSAVSSVATKLNSPGAFSGKFEILVANALQPIFAPESLDTILTPWFVDIIPEPPSYLFELLNSQLKIGGRYVCLGSLAFQFPSPAWNLSPEEFDSALIDAGFKILKVEEARIPYMQSPHSAHGRIENVRVVVAEKISSREAPKRKPSEPNWIIDTSLPVPLQFSGLKALHSIPLEILESVDGKRSIDAIAREVLLKNYSMTLEDSLAALRNFFRAQASKVAVRG